MLARVITFALDGIDARRVDVEADVRVGLPTFTIVGLADKAVREARERVRAAIENSGFVFPQKRITVNLAPAYLRKVGPGFDLPLALAILVAGEQLAPEAVARTAVVGELSLTGAVRSVRGVLAMAECARAHGMTRLVVPVRRAREAALVDGLDPAGVESLEHAVAVLRGVADAKLPPVPELPARRDDIDLADVRGHVAPVVALEVAAAGGHNLFLHGPPGTGKTMLARRLPTLLPPLEPEEAIAVTRVHSVAGLHGGGGLVGERPFRAPHHSISASGLVGGGSSPQPGEVTLAHHGVLFLDELSEFNRAALEALRTPLEDRRVTIVRGQRVMAFPSNCLVVAASNPCPCGRGEPGCRCSAADLVRHERKLSGPLLDRIDVQVAVERPSADALRTLVAPTSAEVRARVVEARERQARRLGGTGARCNADMDAPVLRARAAASPAAAQLLFELHDRHALSARGHDRVLRVARTLADLAGSDEVQPEHIRAAVALRSDDVEAVAA